MFDDGSMAVLLNKHTVRIERLVPGPIERVWSYFTESDRLIEWIMPGVVGNEVGGLIEFVSPPVPEGLVPNVKAQPHDVYSHGLINEYDPPRLLAYSFNESIYDSSSQFRIELEERDGQILIVLIHSHLEPEWMAVTATGWHLGLMVLHSILTGGEKPDVGPTFERLHEAYKVIVAGAGIVIVTTTASPAFASGLSDEAYNAMRSQKHQLLVKYDSVWKDAQDIEKNIAKLERAANRDDKALDVLYRDLKYKKMDLGQIEVDVRDLDKVLIAG